MSFTPEMRQKAIETNRRKAEERRAAKALMSTGVGESKVFRDPDAPDPYAKVRAAHVGGMPVADLPEETIARLSYSQTDEGIAERNEGKVESAARVISDPLAKQREARHDFLMDPKASLEPWEAPDPLKAVADAHVQPGMKARFLSNEVVKHRGTRGYQPVIVNGDPVKVGNMVLGQMPEEMVDRRNKHYRDRGKEMLEQVTRQYRQEGGKTAVSDQ